MAIQRAAVVIGVNATGRLPVLGAAISGANLFAAWLKRQGFAVVLLTDAESPVTANTVSEAVTRFVDNPAVEQLVIYFGGHGFLHKSSEFWLLSGAPRNANEAVNLVESVELARGCAIPSVVFISDACRSTTDSLQAQRVSGSLIFPNDRSPGQNSPEIDRFFATLPGDPSLEIPLADSAGRYEGVYTRAFLKAYAAPEAEMVRKLREGSAEISVVPNRVLKPFVRREVEAYLSEKGIPVKQKPDAIVESGDNIYIGRVDSLSPIFDPVYEDLTKGGKASPAPRSEVLDLSELSRLRIRSQLGLPPRQGDTTNAAVQRSFEELGYTSGFDSTVIRVHGAEGRTHFETQTGLTVLGISVAAVHSPRLRLESMRGIHTNETHVRVYPDPTGSGTGSVFVHFGNGNGSVVAALDGYIGTVIVEEGKVINVSYVPSRNAHRWLDYSREKPRLEQLRATVAAASHHGVFRVQRDDAAKLAKRIRFLKAIDPTLGLYASYAYSAAGLRNEVRSVLAYMDDDLCARLFDVALLAGEIRRDSLAHFPIVPFCPMLSQGWALLRARGVKLTKNLELAGEHLLDSIWTTFDSQGADLVMRAMREER